MVDGCFWVGWFGWLLGRGGWAGADKQVPRGPKHTQPHTTGRKDKRMGPGLCDSSLAPFASDPRGKIENVVSTCGLWVGGCCTKDITLWSWMTKGQKYIMC